MRAMITAEKLAVYIKYNCNPDYWARLGHPHKDIISPAEMCSLEELLQELGLYQRAVISERLRQQIEAHLREVAPDKAVAEKLMELARST